MTTLTTEEMYFEYKNLVTSMCKKYVKQLPQEELNDLTQSVWEQIIKKYKTYDAERGALSTWIVLVAKSTLSNILKESKRDKRAIQFDTVSLETVSKYKEL